MANAHRVADVPEFIVSVATSLSDRRPLLLVSKHFFRSVAPLIWKSVPRVDLILRLIPGTTERRAIRQYSPDPDVHSVLVDITLPGALDLTRFDLYAPWVQRLEVFGGEYKHTLHNAAALIQLASTRPILPNLRALTLTTRAEISGTEYLPFTELFLSPTLAEIRHVRQGDDPPYLRIRSVPELVQKILAVCPGVQILEFYPGQEPGGGSSSERNMIFSLSKVPIHATLAGFSNLRSFATTHYVFKPATLQVLGSLPLLESLDVFDHAEDYGSLEEGLTIPDTWFPALRHLHLRDFDAKDVSIVWSQPLVRNLTSATIKCDPATADENHHTATGQAWVDAFLSKLPQTSPHISKLDLDFEAVPSLGQGTYSLSRAGIDALRQLPLRNIRLYYLWTRCEDLVQAFPGVEEFCSMDGQVDLEQLRVFATHMPGLRSLKIDVRWIVPPAPKKTPRQQAEPPAPLASRSPVVLISRFKLAELKMPLAQLRKMAKFLAEIWPGGFRGEVYPGAWEFGDKANAKKLNQLNEAVAGYLAEAAAATRTGSTSRQA
ncbi:hypothetical protein BDV93DRAFT_547210 [Ceratobasidium sp. AG-I]|nr:hypothetical protein BDV93DRAFT_547210 [Ceratobasidium sp. AG-I]